ncbi:class I SAM-dependent DNA methyltransferase [Falsiruegeria litorea]|nr:methyltransferase domain-containing protein [Falsiruegeria litorea]
MTQKFLASTYNLETPEETRDHYDKWAGSYDAEVDENGYVTPGRVAEALRAEVSDLNKPILDYGCGTGLSGLALRKVGFTTIDGMDPSSDMLDGARAKGAYRHLTGFDILDPAPVSAGSYDIITAIGVIGAGAAPPETFDLLMNALPSGGLLAFSFNDHALADPAFEGRLNDWLDMGAARLLSKEYGDHLPGMNMKSNVYIVEKA